MTQSRPGSRSRSQSTASGVCAPSHSSSSERHSSRPGSWTSASPSIGAAEERLRRLARAARPHLVVGQEVGPLRLAEHDDRARRGDGELLARDRLARLAEDVRVLEPDVRQEDDRRVDDVRRVEPAAEAGFDRGHVDALRGELGQRRRRQRLELRRADALGGRAGRGRRRARSPRHRCRAAPPSPRRGATCTRRLAALRPAAARRSSASRSTSRSCRRRARRGTRAPGGRAPRAARASARARTPPATARATRSRLYAAPSPGMLTTAACTRTVERSSSEGGGRMLELVSPTFTRAAAGLDR